MKKTISTIGRYKKRDFPVSEKSSQQVLYLSMYPELDESSVQFVTATIRKYFEEK